MTLAILAEYDALRERQPKLEALAQGARSPDPHLRREGEAAANKAAAALARIEEIEREHPDIRGALLRAQRAIEGRSQGGFAGQSKAGSVFERFVERTIDHLAANADNIVDGVADELTGAARSGHIPPGEFVLKHHACGRGQVCVEVRMLAEDARRPRRLASVLRHVETALARR